MADEIKKICEDASLPDTQPLNCSQETASQPADVNSWGKLTYIIKNDFASHDLVNEIYSFGRDGKQCTFVLKLEMIHENFNKYFETISKKHFSISYRREDDVVILKDHSANGVFVNRIRLTGSAKQVILQTGDKISVCKPDMELFIFEGDVASNMTVGRTQFPMDVISKYQIGKVIGRGASGEVRMAFDVNTWQKVALKVINKRKSFIKGINAPTTVQTEIDILKSLNFPFVIKVMDVIDLENESYIAMEYVNHGTLANLMSNKRTIPENFVKLIFKELILAVEYLHSMKIVHRDLKPENILVKNLENDLIHVKVTDFGLSKRFDGDELLTTFCGSRGYVAPEIKQRSRAYTPKCDVWSLGVILHECFVGIKPTGDCNNEFKFNSSAWTLVSKEAKMLLKSMLTVDPKKRINIREILESVWLKDEEIDKNILTVKEINERENNNISDKGNTDCEIPKKKAKTGLLTPSTSHESELPQLEVHVNKMSCKE